MGREIIGECSANDENDRSADVREAELAIEYIKGRCGEPPQGAELILSWEEHDLGSYPVIALIWDDCTVGYPDEYIGKCIDGLEAFEMPAEEYERGKEFHEILCEIQELTERAAQAAAEARAESFLPPEVHKKA